MTISKSKFPVLLAGLAMILAACGTGTTSTDTTLDTVAGSDAEALSVVVTTTIWGDIVAEITGDDANVEVLFPVGADPHDYQPSSTQVQAMQTADLVVVNGLQLEEGLLDVIESLEADGVNVLEVAPLLDPIAFAGGGHHHDEEDEHHEEEGDHHHDDEGEHHEEEGEHHDHHHDGDDPHVWMDPLRVASAAELIAAELAVLDSTIDWMANANRYADELRALDDEVRSMLESVPADRKKMVTNHDAFGYFADRYGVEVVGAVIPSFSTLATPSSGELAELVEIMIDENINVIFAETIEPTTLAEAVAAEVGTDVEVVELFTGSLGGPGSGGDSYVDMIRHNAVRVSEALS